jgi:hypothetical protein
MALTIIHGKNFTAFQCTDIEESYWQGMWEEEYELARIEFERMNTPLFDPNRIDTRRVRRELKEPNMVNLGLRSNRVPASAKRF